MSGQSEVALDQFLEGDVGAGTRVGQFVAVAACIQMDGEIDLFQIVQTCHPPGPVVRAGQHRQQQCDQDGDDGNDHQQFNERERKFFIWGLFVHGVNFSRCGK